MTSVEGQVPALRLVILASALLLILCLLLGMLLPFGALFWTTSRMLIQQDIWLLPVIFASWGIAATLGARLKHRFEIEVSRRLVLGTALALTLFCYAGHYLVLQGYNLTRDEQMAVFDAWIFQHGRLVWPIPPEWQPDSAALNLNFMWSAQKPVAWASAYLPGNAAFHALVGKLADPAWTTPLLTGLSLPLLWSIVRKIWPDDSGARAIPLLMFVLSGQVLLSGMSTFAMTAHLFCNFVWLRLFLVNRRSTDLLALVTGFVATGLHQPLFHPLFAAPLLFLVVQARDWVRAGLFAFGYAAIGLFWLSWPGQMFALVSGPTSREVAGGIDFLTRLKNIIAIEPSSIALTGANLLRLFTWQHAALLPMVLAAWPAIRRGGLAAALALGVVLPVIVVAIILPSQGQGFGYRYVHPVLGNLFLLAGFGWQNLRHYGETARSALAVTSIATLLFLAPMWVTMSHARYAPFAAANRKIERSGADYLILQTVNGFLNGEIFNAPDLANRPIRLNADQIANPGALAKRICVPGNTVAMATDSFFKPAIAYFSATVNESSDARLPELRGPYEAAGCRIVLLK